MGTHRLATTKHNNMKVLILVCSLVASIYAEADADAFYGAYGTYGAYGGAALGYPYAYARGYAAPAFGAYRRVAAAPIVAAPAVGTVRTVAAAPIVAAPAVHTVAAVHAAPVVAEVRAAVPTVTSTQFHSQDEAKNYAFGYSNINS